MLTKKSFTAERAFGLIKSHKNRGFIQSECIKWQEKVTHEAIVALTLYRLAQRTTREEEKKGKRTKWDVRKREEKERKKKKTEECNTRREYQQVPGQAYFLMCPWIKKKRVHNLNCNNKPEKGSE